jgi:hypothetical protein
VAEKQEVGRGVEPDPDERDEQAYEDTWYRALKAQSERRHNEQGPVEDADPPTSTH